MASEPEFDVAAAHRFFSAACFNSAWELIDKTDRTPEENQQMVCLCHASLWHWSQRGDCTPKNLSIGNWQASRIYALLGQADNARHYAQLSLQYSQHDEEPFCSGYAYEALARAESIAKNQERVERYLAEARQRAEAVSSADEKKLLLDDLKTIHIPDSIIESV